MMVNMNGLSYRTWRNIQKAIEQFDVPMKSSGNLGKAHLATLLSINVCLTNTVGRL